MFPKTKEQIPVTRICISAGCLAPCLAINAFVMLWHGDILFNYACTGISALPLLANETRGLLIASLVLTLIYCGKIYWAYAGGPGQLPEISRHSAGGKSFARADSVKKNDRFSATG